MPQPVFAGHARHNTRQFNRKPHNGAADKTAAPLWAERDVETAREAVRFLYNKSPAIFAESKRGLADEQKNRRSPDRKRPIIKASPWGKLSPKVTEERDGKRINMRAPSRREKAKSAPVYGQRATTARHRKRGLRAAGSVRIYSPKTNVPRHCPRALF